MDWGLENRLSKIIRRDGKTVMLAVDHGYFLGPTTRLENAGKTIAPLAKYADTLMLTRGILRSSVDPKMETPVVLRVSGGTSIIGGPLSNEGLITAMDDAMRCNASGVALSIFVGTEHEKQTLLNLAQLVDEGTRAGMPVLAVTAVGKDMGRDARYLSLCCRIAAEIGAHIVKTYYCDNFGKVIESCPVPVVIAGGKKLETELDVFEMTHSAISEGAVGVDMGRNIWQHDHPIPMIKAIRAVVHENATPKEALDIFNQAKGGK